MTTTGEPLSDARLEQIRQTAHDAGWMYAESANEAYGLYSTIEDLLAEVERLRAREAALLEIVRAVAEERDPWLPAEGSAGYRCRFCRHWSASGIPRDHTADCAWKHARALEEH